MIENERQLQAARESIEYWKSTMTSGGSWLGNENARAEIMQLQKEIAAYERRQAQEQETKDAADAAARDASGTV